MAFPTVILPLRKKIADPTNQWLVLEPNRIEKGEQFYL
jgi:hypothetical protein